jgi:soluble lytic murein transglycosylase-like protein
MAYPTQFDGTIQAAVAMHMPLWDWHWIKAQLIAESDLDPTAVSPTGARGIAQFEPDTWTDVKGALDMPADANPENPDYAIPACVWYMAQLRDAWTSPRPESERRELAQASYNAGLGNILKAQRFAGGATDYATIIAHLPAVTGKDNARETTQYVERIGSIYRELTGAA